MRDRILTNRYANAAFLAAAETSAVKNVGDDLKKMRTIFADRKDFLLWLSGRGGDRPKRERAIAAIAETLSFNPITMNFLLLLVRKNRIGLAPQIIDRFLEINDEAEGVVRGTVVAADRETATLVKDFISGALKKKLGPKVVLSEKEEPAILGGVILKIGDALWDASIKQKLTLIKESLCQ